MQAMFPQEYFVYCKEKWCGIEEKGPLFGRFDSFLIRPRIPHPENFRNRLDFTRKSNTIRRIFYF